MATIELDAETAMTALETLDELIERQAAKVLAAARRLRPAITAEELARPEAFPDVHRDPAFRFEEGQLAGLRAARIALRAQLVGETIAQG